VVKRALKMPLLECLDFANSTSGTGTRPVTTTAPQALMLRNDAFVREQGAALADRVRREVGEGGVVALVGRLHALAFQRAPTPREVEMARAFMSAQRSALAAEGHADPAAGAFQSLCRAVLNANEMFYVE
jgi:hypothetical protein